MLRWRLPFPRLGAAGGRKFAQKAARQAKNTAFPIRLAPVVSVDSTPDEEVDSGYTWTDFRRGDLVEAFYDGTWYEAYIVRAHRSDKTFTLHWQDDSFSKHVEPRLIRPHRMFESPRQKFLRFAARPASHRYPVLP